MPKKQKSSPPATQTSEVIEEKEVTLTADESKVTKEDKENLEITEEYTINYLSLVDRYMNIYKNDLIPNIKSGFFGLSTTRLNMGAEYLGIEHIPNEDILKSKIHLDSQSLEIIDFDNVASHFDKSLKEEDEEENGKSKLRNRKSKKETEETEESNGSKLEADYEENLKKKNPIYWYGTIQLSEDLVQAQSYFVNALKSALELGKIVKELNELEAKKTTM
ncbi:predicted protein [Naegleria gruberi]|uniref:Vacuolar ATPase assembly protein VMA22 n=1 Tax=Naegleria gruberi TaxID=5762 RepID=D2VU05_NAEGR|nr:uncharacterized protein NAEGRDRAFT_72493 [Naegleria gruberi]EFC39748.1 predicted protein [Naegleria gruberi]|eukprot:XP_002672492.1 predicted protein [Naegleria gruberi strain NEG-M]